MAERRTRAQAPDQAAHHNAVAGDIVKSIVKPIAERGGTTIDVLILTESVLLGVCLFCNKLGGDEDVLDVLVDRVRTRLAEHRLSSIEPAGEG